MKKILVVVTSIIIMLLFLCLFVNFYVNKQEDLKYLMCHKGRVLHKIDVGETVYLKIKGISCEFEKGMIIIEDQS